MTARLLDVTPDEYHKLPLFSSSVAKVLIDRSPLHAKARMEKPPTKAMDRGSAVNTFLLGKGKRIACLPFDDWRTKAARESRDRTREAGMVPMLAEDYEAAEKLASLILVRLKQEHDISPAIPAALDGVSEQAITWTEQTESGPLECKGMLDHVWADRGIILDLKVTEDASDRAIERTAENLGYAIQAAAYTRGLGKALPDLAGRITFLFLFVEPEEPFAINVVSPDGVFREIGERRWMRACETWSRCARDNHWPAYGSGVRQITSPPWALTREGYTTEGL